MSDGLVADKVILAKIGFLEWECLVCLEILKRHLE